MTFKRFAIYYAPPYGAKWTNWASAWLGWDMLAGSAVAPPELGNLPCPLADVTATPRKYGVHGTIKPPFRLAKGYTLSDLETSLAALCGALPAVSLDGLNLTRLGRFLALCPAGDTTALSALAARCVADLDHFRAPASEAELARRRTAGLTPAQETNLTRWGYPYVMDQFRFHITLTGKLPKPELASVIQVLETDLVPLLPNPFIIRDLALVGEDDTGKFHLIHRYTLSG